MLQLSVTALELAIVRLDALDNIPIWAIEGVEFFSITKAGDELSVVCPETQVPQEIKAEKGWRCLKVEGPLHFGLTGILSSLLEPLARAKISIFAISTFETDYILVKKENLHKAIDVLDKFCKILS